MGRTYKTVELKTTYFEKRLKNMDLIKSQTLIRSDGSEVEAKSALSEKDLVLIYFSAKWCPQSERYTPMLKEFYKKVSDKGVEIIFASWDKSSEEMLSNMKESHGDWLALKYDFDGLADPMCTYNMTKQRYAVQKLYKCATCDMDSQGYCICEVCIKTCHDGHETSMSENEEGYGGGFCDCADEGSDGKRICKNLRGMQSISLFQLPKYLNNYFRLHICQSFRPSFCQT